MEIRKMFKKPLIYFVPVMIVQIIFFVLDKSVQVKIDMSDQYMEIRSSIIHLEVYFCLFVIPIYLMIANVINNLKNEINEYYEDIKFIFVSIFISNVCILILNIGSKYIYNIVDINYILEFMMIFIPEMITTGVLSYIGVIILERRIDEGKEELKINEEEGILEEELSKEDSNINKVDLNDEVMITSNVDEETDIEEKEIGDPIVFVEKNNKRLF